MKRLLIVALVLFMFTGAVFAQGFGLGLDLSINNNGNSQTVGGVAASSSNNDMSFGIVGYYFMEEARDIYAKIFIRLQSEKDPDGITPGTAADYSRTGLGLSIGINQAMISNKSVALGLGGEIGFSSLLTPTGTSVANSPDTDMDIFLLLPVNLDVFLSDNLQLRLTNNVMYANMFINNYTDGAGDKFGSSTFTLETVNLLGSASFNLIYKF